MSPKTAAKTRPAAAKPKTARPATNAPAAAAPSIGKAQLAGLRALRKRLGAANIDDVVDGLLSVAGGLERLPTIGDRVIVVGLDGSSKQYHFASSATADLRNWFGTEIDLLSQAESKSGMTAAAIAREGTIVNAKRILANASRAKRAQEDSGERRGIRGAADVDLAAAYKRMQAAGVEVTPAKLATEAKLNGGFRTAQRFLNRVGHVPPAAVDKAS